MEGGTAAVEEGGAGEPAALSGSACGAATGVVGVIWVRMASRCAMNHALTCGSIAWGSPPIRKARSLFLFFAAVAVLRSEERRVGKECRL